MISEGFYKMYVGLFFVANGKLLLHKCGLDLAEANADFANFPESHMDIWDKFYYAKYKKDFDFFPRGRIVYRKADRTYIIYKDACITNEIEPIINDLQGENVLVELDEHYQCYNCNDYYALI